MANHITHQVSRSRATMNAKGAAIQRLIQKKQSIARPAKELPNRARNFTTTSPVPSSSANRCVTRHAASDMRTNHHPIEKASIYVTR